LIYECGKREIILVLGKTGSGKTTWAREYLKKLHRVFICDHDFGEYPAVHFKSFEQLAQSSKQYLTTGNFFRVCLCSPYTFEFPSVCDLARLLSPCHFVVEEADRFPRPEDCLEYEEIIGRGRHYGTSIVAVSRYPFALPAMLRREASRIIAFRHHEPRDIDWLQKVMGEPAFELPNLGDHEFLDWVPNGPPPTPQKIRLKK
jgi:hypothetical protein